MGAILIGICAGSSNPAMLAGNDELFAFWCFLCLPGILLTVLTIFASLMAPALTAPSIAMERDRGTWDMLRATPQSPRTILLAKLFGALARLRIWRLLFAVSVLNGALAACSAILTAQDSLAILGLLVGIITVARPWAEVLFAAFAGMYASTWTRSATMALVAGYTAVVLFKLINNSFLWLAISAGLNLQGAILFMITLGPTTIYIIATALLLLALVLRAEKIAYE